MELLYEMSATQCVRHTPAFIEVVAMARRCTILFSHEAAGQRIGGVVESQAGYSPKCGTVTSLPTKKCSANIDIFGLRL